MVFPVQSQLLTLEASMFRPTRYLFSFAVCLLAACEGDLGPQGLTGPGGPQGPQGPTGSSATYTAGEGISISDNTISVSWGPGGTATTAARSDHNHDARYTATATLSSDDGDGPNAGSNLLHWNRLTGVPAGFADGVDDAGSVTYAAGPGISISNSIISTSLSSDDGDPPNSGSNLVHWNRLTGVPTAFADGTDDGAAESDPTWIGPADTASVIARTGQVSLGTTSTSSTSARLTIFTGANYQGLRIENSSTTDIALKIVNNAGAHRPIDVDNASDEGIRFGTTGNPTNAVNINNSGTGNALRIDNSNGGRGLYVVNSGGGAAGYFAGTSANVVVEGDLDVGGTLSKGGGSFTIDHPLDPENRILRHSFVESPDMMNVYNGIVTTDSLGFALVDLPAYFEALNRDFRYQLTVIGQFAQAIVTEEVRNNRFGIRTNEPHVKVSWQVTGIRKDRWAEGHRIVVEETKPDNMRGLYIHR